MALSKVGKNQVDQSAELTVDSDLTVDTNTLYVDSTNNRVGIGTTSPSTPLTIKTANTLGSSFTGGTAGEGLRVIQDSYTSGNYISLIEAPYVSGNSTANVRIGAMFDGGGGNLSFGTSNNYTTGVTNEAMFIDSKARVYMGTTSALYNTAVLQVKQTNTSSGNNACIALQNQNASGASGVRTIVFLNNAGTYIGSVSNTSSATAYNTSSDYRLKENDVDMTGAIARVKQLQPKRFNFIADPDDTTVDGFMAHEVQTVVPEAITGTHNEVDDEGNPVYQGIDQSKLVPLLTGALQEAIAKIEALEARLTALENA